MNKNESNMVAVILNRFEIELLQPNMIKMLEIQRSVRIQSILPLNFFKERSFFKMSIEGTWMMYIGYL